MQGIPDQNHCQLKLSGTGRVFLLRHSNVSLEHRKKLSSAEKIVQIPVEVPVEQSISSTLEEEELKSNDTTSVVA